MQLLCLMLLAALYGPVALADSANRITIIYDAFGQSTQMKKDWGFSAFIEYGGKTILFDAGNNAAIFAENTRIAGIDLADLDFAVISHRHGDHTTGLSHLLKVNPQVKNYFPKEPQTVLECPG